MKPTEKIAEKEIREEGIPEHERIREREKLFRELERLIAERSGPEEFFSSAQYESAGGFENTIIALGDLAFQAVAERDFSEALNIGRRVLEVAGVDAARNVSVESPNGAVALAEAINWGAKVISYALYVLKPVMIVAAAKTEGVFFGYGGDGAYYLGTPTFGVASFHDYDDEVGYIFLRCLGERIPEWEYEWSGVQRQDSAFDILNDLSSGRGLVERYADLTSPEEMKAARDRYMKDNFRNRLIAVGDLLRHKNSA